MINGATYIKVEIWLLEHNWPTRFPRTYLFWDWVIGVSSDTYGFKAWIKWCLRKDVNDK